MVFPFKIGRLGPKIFSALDRSSTVMGQFATWFDVITTFRLVVEGKPTTVWNSLAFLVAWTCFFVKPSWFLLTVLTNDNSRRLVSW